MNLLALKLFKIEGRKSVLETALYFFAFNQKDRGILEYNRRAVRHTVPYELKLVYD